MHKVQECMNEKLELNMKDGIRMHPNIFRTQSVNGAVILDILKQVMYLSCFQLVACSIAANSSHLRTEMNIEASCPYRNYSSTLG